MHLARIRSTPGRSRVAVVALGLLAVALSACGGAAVPLASTDAPATAPAETGPSAVPARATAEPAATPTPAPTGQLVVVTPPPVAEVFKSPVYGYSLSLPASAEVTGLVAATGAWDGRSAIGSTAPMVDQFRRSGQRLAFITSAPTDVDLDAYAAAVHAKAVSEHGCPEEVTNERDMLIGGAPAKVVAFVCQGLHVYEATTVRDGTGLIAKQITPPPGSPDLERASLDDFMWFLEPFAWGK